MATILTKKSDTSSAVPGSGDLTNSTGGAELAVNTADKRIFTKNSGGTVVEIGTNPTSVTTGTLSVTGNTTLGDASGDSVTINAATVSTPNGLNFDSNTFVIDAANNRVGVGTTSPSGVLHLSANTATTTLPSIVFQDTGTTATRLGSLTNNGGDLTLAMTASLTDLRAAVTLFDDRKITFDTAGSERLRIDSSGNVGIGTSSPAARLHVVSGTDEPLTWGSTDAGYNYATIKHHSAGDLAYYGACGGAAITAGTSSDFGLRANQGAMLFATNGNNERMRIDSSGNVGIGTSSPTGAGRILHINNSGTSGADVCDLRFTTGTTGATSSDGVRIRLANAGDLDINNLEANSVLISTQNTERMRIDSAGNLGLGVTPSAWQSTHKAIDVNTRGGFSSEGTATQLTLNAYYNAGWKYKATDEAALYEQYNGTHAWYTAPSGTAGNAISFTQAMTLDASGNLQLGTTSALTTTRASFVGNTTQLGFHDGNGGNSNFGRLQYSGSSGALILNAYSTGGNTYQAFYTSLAGANAERMRIDSSGNLLVGTTSAGGSEGINLTRPANTATYIRQLKSTQAECTWGFKSSTDTNMYIGSGSSAVGTYGVYLTNTGNSWNAVSDERMKTIVEPIENAAEKVSALRSVIGYYNHDEKQIRRPFLIAQDVQAVLPEAVNIQDEETGTLGMSYTDTIPLLVAAIKELKAENDALKSRLDAAGL